MKTFRLQIRVTLEDGKMFEVDKEDCEYSDATNSKGLRDLYFTPAAIALLMKLPEVEQANKKIKANA